jgi:hypothetical protein
VVISCYAEWREQPAMVVARKSFPLRLFRLAYRIARGITDLAASPIQSSRTEPRLRAPLNLRNFVKKMEKFFNEVRAYFFPPKFPLIQKRAKILFDIAYSQKYVAVVSNNILLPSLLVEFLLKIN